MSAEYGGDATTDIAVFRPSTGQWFVRGYTKFYFGTGGDRPVPADYDGDSGDDWGIFREAQSKWLVRGITRAYYGQSGDLPVTH